MSETRKVKQRMKASETGAHWLAGKTVEILEWDQDEPWDAPIVKVKCEGQSTWMNPKDFEDEQKGPTMYCQGNVENCRADEFECLCGVMCCSIHGHVDEAEYYEDTGEPREEPCPNECGADECPEGFVCDTSLVAEPPPMDGLPCHLRHKWGIFPA